MGANIIAFGSALVFLVQASSQAEGAASAQNCELNLLQLQAMKNRPQAQASAGNCTQADEAKVNEFGSGSHDGSFPEVLAGCGNKAFSWWRGWKIDKMEKCIRDKVKISKKCTKCFSKAGEYGYRHCKSKCWKKWCSSGCLGCTNEHVAVTEACVGVEVPQPEVC